MKGMLSFCQLLRNVTITHDGSGNQLGKHGHVGRKMKQIPLRGLSPVHIHRVAYDLKGIEADADWQGKAPKRQSQPCHSIKISDKKIRILKTQQERKADACGNPADNLTGLSFPVFFH